jgi:hypothetical protein
MNLDNHIVVHCQGDMSIYLTLAANSFSNSVMAVFVLLVFSIRPNGSMTLVSNPEIKAVNSAAGFFITCANGRKGRRIVFAKWSGLLIVGAIWGVTNSYLTNRKELFLR